MVSGNKRVTPVVPVGREQWLINREISAHFRLMRTFIFGHLLNVVLMAFIFAGTVSTLTLTLWCGSVIAVCAHRLYIARAHRVKANRLDPKRLRSLLTLNSIALALAMSLAYAYLPSQASEMQFLFLAVSFSTRISSAGLNLRTLPRCTVSYISIMTTGTVVALLAFASPITFAAAILLVVSAVFTVRSSLSSHNYFVIRILRERELNAASETVRLLLNDYEDQGSDWLFELEANGTLASVSQRFAQALDVKPEWLSGQSFLDLFDDSPERTQLGDHLANNRAFRNLALALRVGDKSLWWSVSARPSASTLAGAARFRGVISDVSSERQAQARARHMAQYDALTELPNRFRFNTDLELLAKKVELGEHFCLLLIDIDRFKSVNDTLGHPIGDHFLKAMSQRISEIVRHSALGGEASLVARLGGDEFGILMMGEGVVDHAIRLCDELVTAAAEPFIIQGHQIISNLSIGLVIAPEDGDTAEKLMHNADLALYSAKDAGRGRWERFEPIMDVAIQKRHAMERDLRKALARNELELYFQPLVAADTGAHVGFEALLRWNHAERGMVMPNDFIPLAEETGLIVPIGEWIIREAMAEAVRWSEPLGVAINISPVQMRSPNLLPTIINALAVTGLDPARFEIEITEGVLLHDTDENMSILHKFHDLGLKIALDDFGTGYSSLNYLRTFPFDKIKIDRSFVNDLENHRDCREIVSAVIGLANNLGMVTLAEGVEELGQLEELRRGGCTMVQGWLFGKAMPAAHYTHLHPAEPAAQIAA